MFVELFDYLEYHLYNNCETNCIHIYQLAWTYYGTIQKTDLLTWMN